MVEGNAAWAGEVAVGGEGSEEELGNKVERRGERSVNRERQEGGAGKNAALWRGVEMWR